MCMLNLQRPMFAYVNAFRRTHLEIHFMYLGKKEILLHLSVAISGANIKSEIAFYGRQVHFCSLCFPYVYSSVELLRKTIRKHSIVISFCYCLLAIIFILKILKVLGTRWYFMY